MWNKAPTQVKCPRGDCKHYPVKPEEDPCSHCTCNRYSEPLGLSFRYESKPVPSVQENPVPNPEGNAK